MNNKCKILFIKILLGCIICTTNYCIGFSQISDTLPIIKKITLVYSDTIITIPDLFEYKISRNIKEIIIDINNSGKYNYSLLQENYKDTVWFPVENNRIIFEFLAQGKYNLILRSVSSHNFSSIHFTIKTNIFENWKNKLIFAAVVLILAYLLFLYRSWSVIQANKHYKIKEITAIEVAKQKEELSVKNKNITDSINYARRIQLAMIPSARYFSCIFPESFIFFKPKDIVSGDFFWVTEKDDKIFVAAVDCTGHGVPGAFMSIIGIELLRKLINNQKIEEPSEVLNELNKNFAEIFKDVENITLRDGMDIAFCTIDKGSRILEFAGAFNPLYLIRDNKITEIKGDRFSVGLEDYENGTQSFTNHHIQLLKDDMIYIFTDGYSDQFGGPEGKKFKYRRFRHLLLSIHSSPVKEQKEHLERSMEEWMGENDQVDDILVIGMKINF